MNIKKIIDCLENSASKRVCHKSMTHPFSIY